MKTVIITAFCFLLSAYVYGQNTPNTCPGVTADFFPNADLPAGGIHFSNATISTVNTTYTYFWDFGNGQQSIEKDPFIMYEEGSYNVKLIVKGSDCESVVEKQVVFSYGGQ